MHAYSTHFRPREIFRGFSALWFLKYLGQFLSALAISGHSERFSPGKIRSEVGRPEGLFKAIGWPTSERIFFYSVFGDPHRQWKFRIEDRGGPPPTSVSICVSNFSARACSHWGPQPTMSTYITYDVYILLLRIYKMSFLSLWDLSII